MEEDSQSREQGVQTMLFPTTLMRLKSIRETKDQRRIWMCVGGNEPEEVTLCQIMERLVCYSRWFGQEPKTKRNLEGF